ncbi:sec24D protein [Culex quinquefasciatus]|uniref:Sec24D protein n=1 Tax=Culex quinquefasciatus TaxID=7176 RepID=B0X717_CULQU|nr:sec24D protein [Culex quinquefasciatus]|eukprot:XP_001865439.1 sec24D protein [Culex quinquefasciatus]
MSHFPVNTDMIKQSTVLFELIVSPFVRAGEKELVHPIVQLASWDRFDARPTCVRESSSSTADVVPVPGTYDFVITKDYCRNNTPPKVLAMVFVIDVSYNKVKSGLVHLLCAEFKNNIRHLPVDEGQGRNVHALLFTSCSGQCQLGVLNLSLKTCNHWDLDTTNLFFTKQGLFKLQDNKP